MVTFGFKILLISTATKPPKLTPKTPKSSLASIFTANLFA